MSDKHQLSNSRSFPPGNAAAVSVGTTYEGNNIKYLQKLLEVAGHIEISPDSFAAMQNGQSFIPPDKMEQLSLISRKSKLLVHGVGLSIGSYNGMSTQYLHLVESILKEAPAAWHSEHLAYTMVNGRPLGTMLSLPKTKESLQLITARVKEIQDRFAIPFLLENIISMLPQPKGEDYTDAGFLNEIVKQTGCGLILDIYNLECDAHNHADFSFPDFLNELNLNAVYEIHLAGGLEDDDYFKMDIHSGLTALSTKLLLKDVLSRRPQNLRAITFEILDEFLPMTGEDNVIREINDLKLLIAKQYATFTATE